MDWMQTVGSNVSNWSDRNTSMYQTAAAGVDYANIVALSNYTEADAWINIPVKATDDYVRNLARYLKANLNPTLNVHVEYSNELWNGGDQLQGTYNLLQARVDPMFNNKSDDTGKMAERAAENCAAQSKSSSRSLADRRGFARRSADLSPIRIGRSGKSTGLRARA